MGLKKKNSTRRGVTTSSSKKTILNRHTDLSINSKVAIYGSGKISFHLPRLFDFISSDFVYMKKTDSPNSLELSKFKFVFLAVPDREILNVYNKLKTIYPKSTQFIHFSGCLYFKNILGLHPLMTFNAKAKNIDYEQIPIFIDNKKIYLKYAKLRPLIHFISKNEKATYHAMATMTGNFTQYYLYTIKKYFPKNLSFKWYENLVLASVKSIFHDNAESLLTGPMFRKDINTLSMHKDVLGDKHPRLLAIYKNFEKSFSKEIQL